MKMGPFRTFYLQLLPLFRRFFSLVTDGYRLFRGLRVELWNVSGDECHSRLPLSVLCALPGQEKSYMLKLLFGESFRERSLGRIWSWNILKVAAKAKVDYSVVLARVDKPQYRGMTGKGWFIIPTWVMGELNLPLDPKILNSNSVKSDLKKIRDYKLEIEITRDPQQFEKFYREMHVPYMREIHGDAAYIDSFASVKRRLGNCELFLIRKDGEHISGAIIAYQGPRAHLWLLGVRNGDRAYLKVGAVIGLYYLSLDRVTARGCVKADLGWSRAFLNDGPLRYKRKLGVRITATTGKGIALKTVCLDAATRSFLRNNPFIVEGEAGLLAAAFVYGETPLTEQNVRQLNKEYLYPGLSKLSIYRIPEAGATMPQGPPLRLSAPLQIRAKADEICVREGR